MKKSVVDLIDDDAAVLDSLSTYLNAKKFITRIHRRAHDYMRVRERLGPADCIVSDVRMPRLSGLELQTLLNHERSREPLILITGFATIDAAVSAVKAGAFDFIEKPISERRLVVSINAAIDQTRRFREEQRELLKLETRICKLTPREKEVLNLAARGLTSREIAAELGISSRTVEVHRASVMQKTNAGSIADLVRLSMQTSRAPSKRS